jgi:hypothetical protein
MLHCCQEYGTNFTPSLRTKQRKVKVNGNKARKRCSTVGTKEDAQAQPG